MSDERNREDALSRFWNALIRGERHASEADLTQQETEVVHRLQRVGVAPVAGSSAKEAWPRVLARIEASGATKTDPFMSAHTNELVPPILFPNGRAPGDAVPRRNMAQAFPWHRRASAQLATAALLLLTLVTSVIAFGWPRSAPSEQPALLPAQVATPAVETTVETLFTVVLPAEQISTVAPTVLVIWNLRIDPGMREAIAPAMQSSVSGPQITYIVEGDLTLTVDGPLRVHHGAMSGVATNVEQVAPGTEITLHAGDTAVYDTERPTEFANLGPNTVQAISSGYLVGTPAWQPFYDDHVTFVDSTNIYPVTPLPSGPVEVTLKRLSLAPGESTARPPKGSAVVQVGADGDVSIGENSDGSLSNINPREVSIYTLILTPLGADTGAPATQPPREAVSQDP